VAEQIATNLPDHYRCVATRDLGPAQRASFAYLGNVKFASVGETDCDYLLVQDDGIRRRGGNLKKIDGGLQLLWQGQRLSDRNEWFRLFKRINP
jgi:hypothetical protein